ncbi:MAG: hypothetical protein ABI462_13745 [Ignavibacteria bacterium]
MPACSLPHIRWQAKRMPFSEKILFIERNIPGVDTKQLSDLKFIHNIRNCIMHNNGIADSALQSKYKEKQKISLNRDEVNDYGILVRETAKDLWNNLSLNYPSS